MSRMDPAAVKRLRARGYSSSLAAMGYIQPRRCLEVAGLLGVSPGDYVEWVDECGAAHRADIDGVRPAALCGHHMVILSHHYSESGYAAVDVITINKSQCHTEV